jgi:RimJ/RimL family protein N-acetyltransferase
LRALQAVELALAPVRLLPLRPEHAAPLEAAGCADGLHLLSVTWVPGPGEGEGYVSKALAMQAAGTRWPWVVTLADSGEVVGSTSFHDIVPDIDRLEIGTPGTPSACSARAVNTCCKLLLMQHAFEDLARSWWAGAPTTSTSPVRRAIERLGARKDGVLRHHALRRDGTVRDTVMYSLRVGAGEAWPAAPPHREIPCCQ